jgi:hypothetical protein
MWRMRRRIPPRRFRNDMRPPGTMINRLHVPVRNLEQIDHPLPNPLTVRMPFDELRNIVINGDDDVPEQQQELILQPDIF